jgi:hypothetical protein
VDGFVVVKKDRHSLLKRNVAKGSGDDGFDIESSSTELTLTEQRTTAVSASRESPASTTAAAIGRTATATHFSA